MAFLVQLSPNRIILDKLSRIHARVSCMCAVSIGKFRNDRIKMHLFILAGTNSKVFV